MGLTVLPDGAGVSSVVNSCWVGAATVSVEDEELEGDAGAAGRSESSSWLVEPRRP